MINQYYISAYATSPSFHSWEPEMEAEYFRQLRGDGRICGIEHPLFLNMEKYPMDWLLKNIPDQWNMVVTVLPALMQSSKNNPYFGLASVDESSRSCAVSLVEKGCDYIRLLENKFKREIVKAIHIHSSPKSEMFNVRGSKEAFYKSLKEIRKINLHVKINIEHCDAFMLGKNSEKGYLTIDDELDVIGEVGGYGMILNWGRSAIETYSKVGPLSHIEQAMCEKMLEGFFFSGCSNEASSDYGQWKDTHMPPQNIIGSKYLRNDSLLGYEEIKNVMSLLRKYGKDIYYGIKVLDPSDTNLIENKVGLNIDTINVIDKVMLETA